MTAVDRTIPDETTQENATEIDAAEIDAPEIASPVSVGSNLVGGVGATGDVTIDPQPAAAPDVAMLAQALGATVSSAALPPENHSLDAISAAPNTAIHPGDAFGLNDDFFQATGVEFREDQTPADDDTVTLSPIDRSSVASPGDSSAQTAISDVEPLALSPGNGAPVESLEERVAPSAAAPAPVEDAGFDPFADVAVPTDHLGGLPVWLPPAVDTGPEILPGSTSTATTTRPLPDFVIGQPGEVARVAPSSREKKNPAEVSAPRATAPRVARPQAPTPSASSSELPPQRGPTPFATGTREISADVLEDLGGGMGMATGAMGMAAAAMGSAPSLISPGLPASDVFSGAPNTPVMNDAAFGGEQLNKGVGAVPSVEPPGGEVVEPEDFSQSDFWNNTDEQTDVPIAPVLKDVAPEIPPTASPAAPILYSTGVTAAEAVARATDAASRSASADISDMRGATASADIADALDAEDLFPDLPSDATGRSAFSRPAIDEDPVLMDDEPGEGEVIDESLAPDVLPVRPQEERQAADRRIKALTAGELALRPSTSPARRGETPLVFTQDLRRRHRKLRRAIPVLVVSMLIALVTTAGALWLLLPSHATVSGSLTYINTPTYGTPEWAAFETQQRNLLRSTDLQQSVTQSLNRDSSGVSAGFVGSDNFAQSLSVSFLPADGGPNNYKLQLVYHGTDPSGDPKRMSALLIGLYNDNADIHATASKANSELRQWLPIAQARQTEMQKNDLEIKQKEDLIAAARAGAESLPSLAAAKDKAYAALQSAQNVVFQQQAQLDRISQQLLGVEPPKAGDAILNELQQQMDDLKERIQTSKLTSTSGDESAEMLAKSQEHLTQNIAAAKAVLDAHPDIKTSIDHAIQLQGQVRTLTDSLISRRQDSQRQLSDFKRTMDQIDRGNLQKKFDDDSQLKQLTSEQNSYRTKLSAASMDGSGVSDADQQEFLRKIRELDVQITARQRDLGANDTNAEYRRQFDGLIASQQKQVKDDRDLIVSAVGTLQNAIVPPMEGLSPADRDLIVTVFASIQNLALAQSTYAEWVASADPSSDNAASLQHRLDDIKARYDTRKTLLAAAPAPVLSDDQRKGLMQKQAQLQAEKDAQMKQADLANTEFNRQAVAYVNASSLATAALDAEQSLLSLKQKRSIAQSSLNDVMNSRDRLQREAATVLDIKQPTQQDVITTADNSTQKMMTILISTLGVAIVFAAVILWTYHLAHRDDDMPVALLAASPPPALPAGADKSDSRPVPA